MKALSWAGIGSGRVRWAAASLVDMFEHLDRGGSSLAAWGLCLIAYLVLAPFYVVLMPTSAGHPSFMLDFYRSMLNLGAVFLLGPLPYLSMTQLHAARGVWRGRRLPQAALEAVPRNHRRVLTCAWLGISLPLMAIHAIEAFGRGDVGLTAVLAVFEPLAVLAAWMALSLVLAGAQRGLLAWAWAPLAVCLMVGLCAWPFMGPQAHTLATKALSGSPAWSSMLTLATSVAAVMLWLLTQRALYRRLAQDLSHKPRPPATLQRVRNAWDDAAARGGWMRPAAWSNQGWVLPMSLAMLGFGVTSFAQPSPFSLFGAWGGSVTPWDFVNLSVATLGAMGQMRGDVFQRRVVLAPGRRGSRRWLVPRLIATTWLSLLVQVLFWAALFVPLFAAMLSGPSQSLGARYAGALNMLPSLLAMTLLAVSIEVLTVGLRARRYRWSRRTSRLLWLLLFVGFVSTITLTHINTGPAQPGFTFPELWHRGAWHFVGLLVLTFIVAVLAQRTWMRVDLGRLADPLKRAAQNANFA